MTTNETAASESATTPKVQEPVQVAADLIVAWLGNPNTRASAEEVLAFLTDVHGAVKALLVDGAETASASTEEPAFTPAVSVRKSLASPDHIVSLIDGKPYKMLTRHLSTHGLTPDSYRARYGLKADYPMVAPTYSKHRRELAQKIGLGRKRRGRNASEAAAPAPSSAQPAKPAKRGRRKASAQPAPDA